MQSTLPQEELGNAVQLQSIIGSHIRQRANAYWPATKAEQEALSNAIANYICDNWNIDCGYEFPFTADETYALSQHFTDNFDAYGIHQSISTVAWAKENRVLRVAPSRHGLKCLNIQGYNAIAPTIIQPLHMLVFDLKTGRPMEIGELGEDYENARYLVVQLLPRILPETAAYKALCLKLEGILPTPGEIADVANNLLQLSVNRLALYYALHGFKVGDLYPAQNAGWIEADDNATGLASSHGGIPLSFCIDSDLLSPLSDGSPEITRRKNCVEHLAASLAPYAEMLNINLDINTLLDVEHLWPHDIQATLLPEFADDIMAFDQYMINAIADWQNARTL
ncbi:hypothetical protein GC177_00645 [bacterium]|nr:hypothetical protein [bacterium]